MRGGRSYFDEGLALVCMAYVTILFIKRKLDAADQISLTRYMEGEAKRKARDWDGAVAAFELAGDYRDAKIQIQATRYAEAESRREAQDWNGAVKLFIQLGDYGDDDANARDSKHKIDVHSSSCSRFFQ